MDIADGGNKTDRASLSTAGLTNLRERARRCVAGEATKTAKMLFKLDRLAVAGATGRLQRPDHCVRILACKYASL